LDHSIATGQINAVEVPYCIVIQNYSLVGEEARQMAGNFVDLIRDLAAEGCPVEIKIEN
jgi:hypothetical protein